MAATVPLVNLLEGEVYSSLRHTLRLQLASIYKHKQALRFFELELCTYDVLKLHKLHPTRYH